jgi:hypothetical protein
MPTLKHFHFYSARSSSAKCGFSWEKAAPAVVALYAPEVKMLYLLISSSILSRRNPFTFV